MQIGDYLLIEDLNETIRLFLRMPNVEISNHWSRCGLIANFCSTYISMGCATDRNIANSLSFILNELLENSVKYSINKNDLIEILLLQKTEMIIIQVSNYISNAQYKKMSSEATELLNLKDANLKFFEKIASNAKNSKKSGLGLLTLINYFNVKIGFNFYESDERKNVFKLSVQIKANTKEL